LKLKYRPAKVDEQPVRLAAATGLEPQPPRRERVRARLGELQSTWPSTFRRDSDPGPWPALKVGIHIDVEQIVPELARPRRLFAAAMRLYTSREQYLAGMVEGAPRLGLDGEPCGKVTAQQAARALARLHERGR